MLRLDILDKMSDKIYITDMQTNEILFANRSIQKLIGKDLTEIQGEKCYRVLHDMDAPCEFCTNHLLKENEFYDWSMENRLFGKKFSLHDTIVDWDGRKCRLEISSEIEEEDPDVFYEKLGNEVLGTALREENLEEGINKSIGLLGEKMEAERIYIFEIQGDCSSNTYEWCAEGVSSEIDQLQNIENRVLAPWYQQFEKEGEVLIENLEALKESHPDIYEYLKPQNIRTLVAQPFYIKKKLRGFFGVDNIERSKMARISSFMKMIGTYIADVLEKRDNRFLLESMSKFDTLTSIYNRKVAEHLIDESLQMCGGALMIIDLDCFKSVNDLFGHQRGDSLLQEVAQKMQSICRGTDIVFRLGGDEFGIYFISLVNEETIAAKCESLLKAMNVVVEDETNQVDVSVSIGVSIAPQHGTGFLELYANADKELYRAKELGKNTYSIHE